MPGVILHAPAWLGNKPENVQLLNHFIELSKKATTPLNIVNKCREFKNITNSDASVISLSSKIGRYRAKVHNLEDLNIESKVRILFALSATIDRNFLIELEQNADVTLDERGRIMSYKEHGGGLELYGKHVASQFRAPHNIEREAAMMTMLAEKAIANCAPVSDRSFVRDYKEFKDDKQSDNYLKTIYQNLKTYIYTSTDYDTPTKIKMLILSSAKIPNNVLIELRKNATVNLDDDQRIISYQANDGALDLSADHSAFYKKKNEKNQIRKRAGINDYQGEAGDFIIRDVTTKSGRVSRKRHLFDGSPEYSMEPDEISSDDFDYEPYLEDFDEYYNDYKKSKDILKTTLDPELSPKKLKFSLTESEKELERFKEEIWSTYMPKDYIKKEFLEKNNEDYHASSSSFMSYIPIEEKKPLDIRPFSTDTTKNKGDDNLFSELTNFLEDEKSTHLTSTTHDAPSRSSTTTSLINVGLDKLDSVVSDFPHETLSSCHCCQCSSFETASSESDESIDDSIGILNFLKMTRGLIDTLDAPFLAGFKTELNNHINNVKERGLSVPVSVILLALNETLRITTKAATLEKPMGSSISFGRFLRIFRSAVINLKSPELADFENNLKELGEKSENQKKRITLERIRFGLEYSLDLVLPLI